MTDIEPDSEHLGSCRILSIDDAKRLRRVVGRDGDEFEKDITTKQDSLFTDIMCIIFGWKMQPDGSKKLVSKLPNGKIVFPDRSEEISLIEPGIPYICLVFEREREAFAKVCAEEYQPKIYVPTSRMPSMVWKTASGETKHKLPHGNSYELRILEAIKEMEDMGFPTVRIIFRKNQKF
jgi:hypothetical protein